MRGCTIQGGWPTLALMETQNVGPVASRVPRRGLVRGKRHAAADRKLVEAYHFPFPACGNVVRSGAGFELAPVMWSPL